MKRFLIFLTVDIIMEASQIMIPQVNHPLQVSSFRLGP